MKVEQMLYDYSYENRERFNPILFERDDNDIVEELMKVIKSCERSKFYTIQVESFEIIDSPIEVYNKLKAYEQARIDRSTKDQDNIYNYIPIKDSKIKLLVINYLIGIREKFENLQVLIAIPRFVDKYYFEIQGNYYLPMHQIVDGSTYNNANTNAKSASITQKTLFMPMKVFRFHNTVTTIDDVELPIVLYTSKIFNKTVIVFKYILAKYGLLGTLEFAKLQGINILDHKPEYNPELEYVFEKNGIYLTVPKLIFDSDYVTQSFVYTVLRTIVKDVTYEDLFTIDHWIVHLDSDIVSNYNYDKGAKLLESLEGIYDMTTMEDIKLPLEYKDNIYKILLWMMRSFSDLMMKDNQDVSMKKVRMAEYIASLYAMKLSTGIHRIAANGKRATIATIRKSINIAPNYLLTQITKCTLINYRNSVNEDDAIASTKFSYKGIAGIGEKNGSNVSEVQRRVDPSDLGIKDTCSSSDTTPGLTGVLCPYSTMDEDGFFKDYEEPNSWEEKFSLLMDEYKSICGLVEVATFKNKLLSVDNNEELEMLLDSKRCAAQIVGIIRDTEMHTEIIPGMMIPAQLV